MVVQCTGHFHKQAATTERGKEYISRFERKFKKDADAFGALAADAYFLLVDGIRRADSTEGIKIRDALADTRDFQGVSGIISMGENGNPAKTMVINQVRNGRFVYFATVPEMDRKPIAEVGQPSSEASTRLGAEAFYEKGNQLFEAGDYKNAIYSYEKALEFDKGSPPLYYNLANAQMAVGQDKEAITNFHNYLRLRPEASNAREVMATIKKLEKRVGK